MLFGLGVVFTAIAIAIAIVAIRRRRRQSVTPNRDEGDDDGAPGSTGEGA